MQVKYRGRKGSAAFCMVWSQAINIPDPKLVSCYYACIVQKYADKCYETVVAAENSLSYMSKKKKKVRGPEPVEVIKPNWGFNTYRVTMFRCGRHRTSAHLVSKHLYRPSYINVTLQKNTKHETHHIRSTPRIPPVHYICSCYSLSHVVLT
jgi:hypothetical protein